MSMLLQVQNISAGYGEKEIIHDISFSLPRNTLTGLLGPNGCGKTTLIRCIINQLPHRGSCSLKGKHLEHLKPRQLSRNVSYIAQRSSISVSLPVLDVVLMGYNPVLKLLQYPGDTQIHRALEALQRVGLSKYTGKDFQTLSEGQKQLVFLARTMIEDTQLLVLDEPDSALDFQNRFQMLSIIKPMVNDHPKAGLLCLHDPALALEFCDQILLMKDGRIAHTIHPSSDDISVMDAALKDLYGSVSLAENTDSKGNRHLSLLWEGVQ